MQQELASFRINKDYDNSYQLLQELDTFRDENLPG